MAPVAPRLRILSVGGNAVSAFLSWRLQATNACDVTLVWKSGYDAVSQYGISFKSEIFGNERFKPHSVVRTPEDAAQLSKQGFDYVLLCVKALPDVYDLSGIIESVVTPHHTCILMNTTNTLGAESYLEQRFPTNVVLSLVSGAELNQTGPAEFEHKGSTDIWVGSANKNPQIPLSIQSDMADALGMTLSSGQVNCTVSPNIRQQQYEKMIGKIAFHPASVIFETPNHAELLEKVGVRAMVSGIIDELIELARAQGCTFPDGYKEHTIEEMIKPEHHNSIMYQDFVSKRPMEVENYLGAPIKLAKQAGVTVPAIETLYAVFHHLNIVNQTRPAALPPTSPMSKPPPSRMGAVPGPRPPMNGVAPPMKGRGSRAPSINGAPPQMRRGNPSMSGHPRQMNGNGYPGPQQMQRRPSVEEDLGEFSHLMLYDGIPEDNGTNGVNGVYPDGNTSSSSDLQIRERELALRQKELALREREYRMRQAGPARRPPPSHAGGFDDDDDDDGDFFDPMALQAVPVIDADNFDMMSVTSRRTRKTPSASQLRNNPEMAAGGPFRSRNPFSRPAIKQNRTSARLMAEIPGLHDSIMNNPLMGYSSDRYGSVDRQAIGHESRTNSLTSARLNEMRDGPGPAYNGYPPMARRASQSPGNPLSPGSRMGGRPSPPNGYPFPPNGVSNGVPNGVPPQGRPSPPGMRQPIPRHPPGHGDAVAPQQVEQHAGVSTLYPPKPAETTRSLTGSASASAESGSGDNASAQLDYENSAHSSQSSFAPRAAAAAAPAAAR